MVGWSLYDFANTIYSMNILSLYLKRWIVEDLGREGLYYDIAFSGSMLLTGILMPALGAFSDHSGKKKLFLFLFTFFCCLSTGLLPLIPLSAFAVLLILFAASNFFYEGGMVFYNSLLYSVAEGEKARLISGVGVAWGYLGSIVGMILVLPAVTGSLFGQKIPGIEGYGKAGAFLPTAIFFFLFSIPLFLWVKERKSLLHEGKIKIKKAYQEVWQGIKETGKYPGVMRFIVADYFFEDAVATVILNIGIFSSLVLGFSDADLTVFLIVSTLSAMVGSFAIGKLSQGRSLKRLMFLIIWGWLLTLGLFIVVEDQVVIYLLGSALGVLLGGLWTVSRPLLAERVPREELGRFFGLYSLSGRAAAVFGPIIWGVTVYFFSPDRVAGKTLAAIFGLNEAQAAKLPYRCAVISLMIMMSIGLMIFRKLPERTQTFDDK